jgi:cell wall-associated NlpC family hydrolase
MSQNADALVACARGWLGTRFHHQGRLKKSATHNGGVDCLGLLIGVAAEMNLVAANGQLFASADETDYSHQPDALRLRQVLSGLLAEIPPPDMAPGDVVLLTIDSQPQHLAIVSDFNAGTGLIHAYAPARAVVEHALDEWWRTRIVTAFRII